MAAARRRHLAGGSRLESAPGWWRRSCAGRGSEGDPWPGREAGVPKWTHRVEAVTPPGRMGRKAQQPGALWVSGDRNGPGEATGGHNHSGVRRGRRGGPGRLVHHRSRRVRRSRAGPPPHGRRGGAGWAVPPGTGRHPGTGRAAGMRPRCHRVGRQQRSGRRRRPGGHRRRLCAAPYRRRRRDRSVRRPSRCRTRDRTGPPGTVGSSDVGDVWQGSPGPGGSDGVTAMNCNGHGCRTSGLGDGSR